MEVNNTESTELTTLITTRAKQEGVFVFGFKEETEYDVDQTIREIVKAVNEDDEFILMWHGGPHDSAYRVFLGDRGEEPFPAFYKPAWGVGEVDPMEGEFILKKERDEDKRF